MIDANDVRRAAPSQLDETASMAHRAVQHLTRAARANLAPAPDDSHSNLSWMEDGRAFLSQPMTAGQSEICIGISILEFELFVMRNGARESLCQLDGARDADVAARLDALLAAEGLKPSAPITLPYDLPAPVAQIDVYALSSLKDEIKVLASWYSLAAGALSAVEAQSRDLVLCVAGHITSTSPPTCLSKKETSRPPEESVSECHPGMRATASPTSMLIRGHIWIPRRSHQHLRPGTGILTAL
jgi:hypothetical protein